VQLPCCLVQIHWPDRYVPLFGAPAYDAANERQGDISFEEQLKGLERVITAGKVGHCLNFWHSWEGLAGVWHYYDLHVVRSSGALCRWLMTECGSAAWRFAQQPAAVSYKTCKLAVAACS
jgi:aryl-alcohol dehydrogenase-like predicted oxidoreductase